MILGLVTLVVLILPSCSSQPDDIVPLIDNLELRKTLIDEYDANGDNKLTPDEVKLIKKFSRKVDGELTGIKYLTDLEEFHGNCLNCQSLDLHDNAKLEEVDIMNLEDLHEIKVNPNIQKLRIARAKKLKKVNLGSLPFVQSIVITESPVDELITGECPSLTWLTIDRTYLKNIDLSLYPRLEELFCSDTGIDELDLSMLPNLKKVRCKGVRKVIVSPEQKIKGLNIAPDYKYCIDKDTQIITKK